MLIVIFLVGLAGAGLVSFGAWMVYQPAGLIIGGLLALLWSWLMARTTQETVTLDKEG
jgi:hypothetical protein